MDLSNIANNINYRYQSSSRMQIGGAVSGLDTQSIIEKLLEVEAIPLNRLNDKYLQYTNLQKAYQKVSEKIRGFYNYIGNFSLQSNLMPKTATSASNILTAQASAVASDGVYSINVLSLATNSTFTGESFAKQYSLTSLMSDIDTRYIPSNSTVKIKVGTNETTVNIDTTNTIQDVVDSLQSAFSSLGATATITFDSSNGKLNIQSDKAFQISNVSGNFTFLFRLNDASLKQVSGSYVLESSGNIGAYSSYKTLENLGIVSDTNLVINGKTILLQKTDTIANVIKKINNSVSDINAVYDDKNGKIVLTSKTTGDNLIDVSGDASLLSTLGFSTGTFVLGQTAKLDITINGYTNSVESKNNSITYNGITFNLSATGSTTVTVSTDKEKIVDRVQEFVDKWNELTDFLYTKLTENKVTGKSEDNMTEDEKLQGLLKNDSFLRRIFDKFRSFLTQSVDSKTLADLGITSGDEGKSFTNTMKGKINLDKDKLREFIDKNGTDAVWSFFGKLDGDKGLAIRIKDYSYQLTKFNGDIDTVAGVQGRLEREKRILSKRMVTMMEYLQKKEQMLWAKYSSLESALAKLSAQGGFLAQAFAQKK
ncbi:flagellar filament capping protein FliD [Fervidobacterium nodosum]|uniref:Flagellar hook-associated protein 2 n=1 Tax=Fervidobacterium nodosum (strain ATCC 35602 / DSM 5306 / Rt17-B1) TaxID=381764 RepID=A7HK32_FERNB|nr:flagellar filament capping protein FliD [Fervidobacterium nodosum]ABS60265.1 flagellar hook-associated 2 domain protein [Fervidobacterium nodosum Rt17-B1]PHJ14361.1 flagellar hook protein [Fervidobacterium sp. SC_NGM5_G05]